MIGKIVVIFNNTRKPLSLCNGDFKRGPGIRTFDFLQTYSEEKCGNQFHYKWPIKMFQVTNHPRASVADTTSNEGSGKYFPVRSSLWVGCVYYSSRVNYRNDTRKVSNVPPRKGNSTALIRLTNRGCVWCETKLVFLFLKISFIGDANNFQWPVIQLLNTTTRMLFEILFVMLIGAIVFPFALGIQCLHENEKNRKVFW